MGDDLTQRSCNCKVTHTLTMKFPSSSGVTMTTESCSFSSKWTCDGAPVLVGSSEKRTPPAFAQPDWKEGGKGSDVYTNTGWTALKGGKRHIKLQHLAAVGGTMECATEHFTLAIAQTSSECLTHSWVEVGALCTTVFFLIPIIWARNTHNPLLLLFLGLSLINKIKLNKEIWKIQCALKHPILFGIILQSALCPSPWEHSLEINQLNM